MKSILSILFVLFFAHNIVAQDIDKDQEPAHESDITCIAYTNSGSHIISTGNDKKMRLWEAATGDMIYVRDIDIVPQKLLISPDDRYLIISQNAGKNILYNLSQGEKIKDLLLEEVSGFTPDSKKIISISYNYDGEKRYPTLAYADIMDENFITYFSHGRITENSSMKNAVISKDGSTIYLPGIAEEILILSTENTKNEALIKINKKSSIISLLSGDTAFIVNGSNKIYMISDSSKFFNYLSEPTLKEENSIIISDTGRIINYGTNEYKIFESRTGKLYKKGFFPSAKITAMDPKGLTIAYTEDKSSIKVESIESKEMVYLEAKDIRDKIAYQNYLKGIYFLNGKKYDLANMHFDKAENKTPKAKKIYYLKGEAFLNKGLYEEAIKNFLIDHELHPGRSTYKIAQGFAGLNDAETSLQWLDSAAKYGHAINGFEIQEDPLFAPVLGMSPFAERLKTYKSKDAERYLATSDAKFKANQEMAGLEYINKAVSADPTNPDLYRRRAKVYLRLHEWGNARKDYLMEATLDSLHIAESYLNAAMTYSKEGKTDSTIVWINKSIQSDSSFTFCLIDIAEMYESAKKRDLALMTLNDYLKLVPLDHYAVYLRASLMPIPETALEEVKKAIDLCKQQNDQVPVEYYNLMSSLNPTVRK